MTEQGACQMRRGVLVWITGIGLLSACAAARQEADGTGPVLGGPSVQPRVVGPTLVERDYAGAVKRLDMLPEEAALKLLELDDATRAAADAVLAQRAAILDTVVVEQLDLLVKLGTASAAGDKRDQLALALELARALEPLRQRGTLREELGRVLPPGPRARFDALLDEYWNAIVEEHRAGAAAAGLTRPGRFGVLAKERLEAFGREIERSVRRQLEGGGTGYIDYLLHKLDLTEAQRARIGDLTADFLERHAYAPTEEDLKELGAIILAHLNARQRAAFIRMIMGQ